MIGEIEGHNWMYDTYTRVCARIFVFIFALNMKEW